MLFPTTIAGSLPKPEWLAEPDRLWAPWRLEGPALATAKADATLLAVKLQEDCGIDIVSDGEQARQHFVHGFLEYCEGIDFAHKVIDVATDITETPEEVAALVGDILRMVPQEHLLLTTNCGMAVMRRDIAQAKLTALGAGAALGRKRYG